MLRHLTALVLSVSPSGETSAIIRTLTAEQGLLSLMAKGFFAPKSRLGAIIQPLALIEATCWQREGASMATLRGASALHAHPEFAADPYRFAAGGLIADAAARFAAETVPAPELAACATEALDAMAVVPRESLDGELFRWLVRTLRVAGIAPRIDDALLEPRPGQPKLEVFWLDVISGVVHARGNQPSEPSWPMAVPPGQLQLPLPRVAVRVLHGGDPSGDSVAFRQGVESLASFVEVHTGTSLRSAAVWRSLNPSPRQKPA